jgi:hypothetical protein
MANETLKIYNVISFKDGDKIVGYTTDNMTIEIVNGKMILLNNDIGTCFYSSQPVIKSKINEKVNTELTIRKDNKSTKASLKSNCIYYLLNNELKIKENIVLIDNSPKFISCYTNILTLDGFDYCFSLASLVDKDPCAP